MKLKYTLIVALSIAILFLNSNCNKNTENMSRENKAIFLHHSTGKAVWRGNPNKIMYKLFKTGDLEKALDKVNSENKTNFAVEEIHYPVGYDNMPYDYYNIWIKNAGEQAFEDNQTLEMLTKNYGTVIWKHCFPVSDIEEEVDSALVDSNIRTLATYKLQYEALKKKMHEFKNTKFLVWTGAAHVQPNVDEDKAKRMKEFVDWVINEWDEKGDNIFIWDFYTHETEGGLYLKEEYAYSPNDSHPSKPFARKVSAYFANRIFNVMNGTGDESSISGK